MIIQFLFNFIQLILVTILLECNSNNELNICRENNLSAASRRQSMIYVRNTTHVAPEVTPHVTNIVQYMRMLPFMEQHMMGVLQEHECHMCSE